MSKKMKLYFSPGACALGPQIVLREAGMEFEMERVDLKAKQTESGKDFWKINPKGYVPVLEFDDGVVLTEGVAMVQYIADKVPEKKLVPANGTMERTRVQEMLNYITSELHKGTGLLFNSDLPESFRPLWKERLVKRYAYVDEILGKTPYLMGKEFGVADAYLYNVTRWAVPTKVDLSGLKNLQAFMARVAERPTVQAAIKAEGLEK